MHITIIAPSAISESAVAQVMHPDIKLNLLGGHVLPPRDDEDEDDNDEDTETPRAICDIILCIYVSSIYVSSIYVSSIYLLCIHIFLFLEYNSKVI